MHVSQGPYVNYKKKVEILLNHLEEIILLSDHVTGQWQRMLIAYA